MFLLLKTTLKILCLLTKHINSNLVLPIHQSSTIIRHVGLIRPISQKTHICRSSFFSTMLSVPCSFIVAQSREITNLMYRHFVKSGFLCRLFTLCQRESEVVDFSRVVNRFLAIVGKAAQFTVKWRRVWKESEG